MKGSFTLVASALAAAALTSSTTSDRDASLNPRSEQVNSVKPERSLMKKERYAPNIDGLRFIETLVTAHR